MIHAKEAIQQVITQIDQLLQQIEVSDYRRPLSEFDGSTLGQHFRHILEFFLCYEKGVPEGIIDYASRERNLLFEENPAIAAAAFDGFTETLQRLNTEAPVEVKAEFGGNSRPLYQSTLGRELLFVYDHAVHHLAIIKIGLNCSCAYVQTDKNLGVSPSTIKSRLMSS